MKILIIFILLIILFNFLNKKDHFSYIGTDEIKIEDIFKHSLMIHLENHEGSTKRLKKMDKIYKKYKLPYYTFPALHWKRDEKKLSTLPVKRSKPAMWGGSWGLAGSFYECLKYAKDHNYPFLLFLEDDAFPLLDKENFFKDYKKIIKEFKKGINSNNVYFLSYTRYCKIPCKGTNKFIKRSKIKGANGAHSVLFTKRSINSILKHIEKHTIDKPIDKYLPYLNDKGIIKTLVWDGKISKSGMFCGMYDQLDTYCDRRVSVIGKHFYN